MANGNFFTGYPSSVDKVQRYGQPGQNAIQQLLSQGQQNTNFQGIEDRARKQFNTQTIPSLAERFTAMGGGQRSSAFQGAIGQASSDLESQLGSLRSQYGLQQLGLGLGSPETENFYTPSGGGLGAPLAGGISSGAGTLGSLYLASKLGLLGGAGTSAATGAATGAAGGIGSTLAGAAPLLGGAGTSAATGAATGTAGGGIGSLLSSLGLSGAGGLGTAAAGSAATGLLPIAALLAALAGGYGLYNYLDK